MGTNRRKDIDGTVVGHVDKYGLWWFGHVGSMEREWWSKKIRKAEIKGNSARETKNFVG